MEGFGSLAEYASRVRHDKGLSLMDVERASARHGEKIAGSYVSRIENGLSLNPSKDKLIALAHGLGVPEDLLFTIARGKAPRNDTEAREVQLTAHFRQLPDAYQEDVLRFVKSLHGAHALPDREAKSIKGTKKRSGSRAA